MSSLDFTPDSTDRGLRPRLGHDSLSPGTPVELSTESGRFLARIISCEVDMTVENPVVSLEVLPFSIEDMEEALRRTA